MQTRSTEGTTKRHGSVFARRFDGVGSQGSYFNVALAAQHLGNCPVAQGAYEYFLGTAPSDDSFRAEATKRRDQLSTQCLAAVDPFAAANDEEPDDRFSNGKGNDNGDREEDDKEDGGTDEEEDGEEGDDTDEEEVDEEEVDREVAALSDPKVDDDLNTSEPTSCQVVGGYVLGASLDLAWRTGPPKQQTPQSPAALLSPWLACSSQLRAEFEQLTLERGPSSSIFLPTS